MCDKKLLSEPPEGQFEYCDGIAHFYMLKEVPINVQKFRPPGPYLECPDSSQQIEEKILENEKKKERENINNTYFIYNKNKYFNNFNNNYNNFNNNIKEIKLFLNRNIYNKLIILGTVGTGKSHICFAIKNNADKKGKECIMISARNLYNIFKNMQTLEYDEIYDVVYNVIMMTKILIIDDLGSEPHTQTELMKREFKNLLDTFNGKIIINGNLTKEKIKEIYEEKIFSRLHENSKFVYFVGKDYRKEKK